MVEFLSIISYLINLSLTILYIIPSFYFQTVYLTQFRLYNIQYVEVLKKRKETDKKRRKRRGKRLRREIENVPGKGEREREKKGVVKCKRKRERIK